MNSVWKLLEDLSLKKGITEVIINDEDSVYIEREGELTRLNTQLDRQDILDFCEQVATQNNLNFGSDYPILDGNLEDGSRINIIASQYTGGLPAITIRKFLKGFMNIDKLDGKFNLSDKWINFFKILVSARTNILISGGTGVGKTTLLNLFLNEISPTERVIIIEDTKELRFDRPNSVRLFTPTTNSQLNNPLDVRTLVRNTLRMRPDRVILGEVRGGEAFDLLQLMNTGHDGSMTTIHANSPSEALMRLENLFLFAGHDVPLKAIRFQMMSAIDFVIQLARDRVSGRVVAHISEVCAMEGDRIIFQDIGIQSEHGVKFTGLVPSKMERLIDAGLPRNFFKDL